jgi:antitoxin (DNA-binding transcriptional repressor) of toxin-antitoxin stability system
MQAQINIYDARTHFSQIIERVESGETIVIARNHVPVAELRPVKRESAQVLEGFLALRERVRVFNGGKPVLKRGEMWRSFMHEDHPY